MNITSITKLCLPTGALLGAAFLLAPMNSAVGYTTLGGNLNYSQRDFRIHNNFSDGV